MKWLLMLAVALLPQLAAAFPVQRCMNMSNALEAPGPEGSWGYVIEQAHLADLRDAGFDTIRLPVRFNLGWDRQIDPDLLARVDEVVGQARALDLNVIIDLHHFEELMAEPDTYTPIFFAIWEELSRHYANADQGVFFELLNEPGNKLTPEKAFELYGPAIDIIRKHNPDRWVIAAGGWFSPYQEMLKLPEHDQFTVHTFHYYVPFKFTHQQLDWVEDPLPERGWGSRSERRQVKRDFDAASRHHTQAFLGEFGVYRRAPEQDRIAWLRTVREAAERHDIGWCVWGFAAGFGIYDAQTRKWNRAALNALIPQQ